MPISDAVVLAPTAVMEWRVTHGDKARASYQIATLRLHYCLAGCQFRMTTMGDGLPSSTVWFITND